MGYNARVIQLHYHPASTFGRRVRIALLEKGIRHELIEVDLPHGAQRSAAYLALNPYGRVPTLVEDEFVIYESCSILNYLEMRYPHPALAPESIRERALMDMHMRLCDQQLGRHAGAILFPKRFLPPQKWDPQAIAAARAQIQQHLQIVARSLARTEYLVGDRFTLADVAYLPFVYFLPLMEIEPEPEVAEWAARILSRPSARQTEPER